MQNETDVLTVSKKIYQIHQILDDAEWVRVLKLF